jgi:two-component system, NtrC family, response regulator HydG
MKPTVLVVDDKPNMLSLLGKVLRKSAHVLTARGVRTALAMLTRERVHVVVCDLRMTDGDGLEVLRAVRQRWPNVPFILTTAYATVPTAVQAMRDGAFDYVTKPFDPDDLKVIVDRALAHAMAENDAAPNTVDGLGPLLGRDPSMRRVQSLVERAASVDTGVLVVGEPGTGKSLVATTIHARSGRAGASFVTVDCGAPGDHLTEALLFGDSTDRVGLPPEERSALQRAQGGVVFLGQVEALGVAAQAKLMRVLDGQDAAAVAPAAGKADVRLIAATSADLRAAVAAGAFREDLFFRLQACLIELPPLRARVSDIPLLARRFLDEAVRDAPARAGGFTHDAMSALMSYRWPGNVRELHAAVCRATLAEVGEEIRLESLPDEVRGAHPLRAVGAGEIDLADLPYREAVETSRENTNRRYLEAVLTRFRGDVVAAAAHADIERESFYRLLRRSGLSADDFREPRPKSDVPKE